MTTPPPIGLRRLMKLAEALEALPDSFSVSVVYGTPKSVLADRYEISEREVYDLLHADSMAAFSKWIEQTNPSEARP